MAVVTFVPTAEVSNKPRTVIRLGAFAYPPTQRSFERMKRHGLVIERSRIAAPA